MLDALFKNALNDSIKTGLTEVVEVLNGGTPKTNESKYWDNADIPFFGPGDASMSIYCMSTIKHITKLGLENCNSAFYPKDTVFLTARGTVGKVAMAGVPMAMNQSCFAFRGRRVSQEACYQIIKRAVRSLRAKANGATFAAINARDLGMEIVAIPSPESLIAFDKEASGLHKLIWQNELETLALSSLRDSLLPKLLSGEIDASKVELTQLNSHLYGQERVDDQI